MQGRHDLLKAFYFDVLKCAVDPRKEENLGKGAGTLWANCGINQFHLPQEAQAQVFAGRIVLEYSDLTEVAARYDRGAINAKERKAVYKQLCRLMCYSPAAAKKYRNHIKRGDPSPIARDWLDAFVRSRRDDA